MWTESAGASRWCVKRHGNAKSLRLGGYAIDGSGDSTSYVNANIIQVNETDVDSVDDFKADVSGLATEANATANTNAIIAAVDTAVDDIDLYPYRGRWMQNPPV